MLGDMIRKEKVKTYTREREDNSKKGVRKQLKNSVKNVKSKNSLMSQRRQELKCRFVKTLQKKKVEMKISTEMQKNCYEMGVLKYK